MARLYEYQSKVLLKKAGIRVPRGGMAATPEEARRIAEEIAGPVVLKIQVWVTGRAGLGGIQFADTPDEAAEKAAALLGMKVKNYVVDMLLVEEKLNIIAEYFAGIVVDDAAKAPVLIFSSVGGTGIEEIAGKHPEKVVRFTIDIHEGLYDFEARNLLRGLGVRGKALLQLGDILTKLYDVARRYDARSAEINPLVQTEEGKIYAADCHLAVDDYAVFRHPELGIEVAREFDRPPTELERIAYRVEENDHRGTFYFLQMSEDISPDSRALGFNGAGGGGSMMSMDAVLNRGFSLANYCDTSGNPSASKVYRAAKVILSQPNIKGYFASGSGVASQEQYHSARGLVKAFHEEKIEIPAVIRLGGNFEEKAIEILNSCLEDIPGTVEGYGRDDSPEFCASRMEELIEENQCRSHSVRPLTEPDLSGHGFSFETFTGSIHINHDGCTGCVTKGCVEACHAGILKLEKNHPVLAFSESDVKKGKCTECLACEIFCRFHERDALFIRLPIPGLMEYRHEVRRGDDRTAGGEKD